MQVVLNLNGDDGVFATTFQDLMAHLTNEDRKEIAKDILMKWLQDPHTIEVQRCDKEALAVARSNAYGLDKDKDDDYFRKQYRYTEYVKNFKSSKIEMIETISKEAVSHFKALVAEKVQTDENLKVVWGVIEKDLEIGFPGLVQQAMVSFFTNMFTAKLQQIEMNLREAKWGVEIIQQKLTHIG